MGNLSFSKKSLNFAHNLLKSTGNQRFPKILRDGREILIDREKTHLEWCVNHISHPKGV